MGLVAGVAAGVMLERVVLKRVLLGVLAGFLAAWLTMHVAWLLAGVYLRRRFAERAAELESERDCPGCGSEDSTVISDVKTTRCPQCGEESLKFPSVGIS